MKPRATALVCHFVIFFFLSQPSAGNHFNISFLLETAARCQLRSRGPKCDAAVNNQSLIKKKKKRREDESDSATDGGGGGGGEVHGG